MRVCTSILVLGGVLLHATPPVKCAPESFNPSKGDRFRCTAVTEMGTARPLLVIRDADWRSIRAVPFVRKAGTLIAEWDGKDSAGIVVPDEAYTVAVTNGATGKVIYDAALVSGGEFGDLDRVRLDLPKGTLEYALSAPSRVLLRTGVKSSAQLSTLVNLEPRGRGRVVEYWDGKDKDGVVPVWQLPNKFMIISYFQLPENSVIAYGNHSVRFEAYQPALVKPQIPAPDPSQTRRKMSPFFAQQRSRTRDFSVRLAIDREAQTISPTPPYAEVRNGSLLKVMVEPSDANVLRGRQFEVMIFIDYEFYAESERGYLPFTFPLDLKQFKAGEHTITVNVTTYDGLSGVASRRVTVVK